MMYTLVMVIEDYCRIFGWQIPGYLDEASCRAGDVRFRNLAYANRERKTQ